MTLSKAEVAVEVEEVAAEVEVETLAAKVEAKLERVGVIHHCLLNLQILIRAIQKHLQLHLHLLVIWKTMG